MKHFVTLIFFYTFYSCSDSNLNDTDNASFDFVKQVGFQTGFVDFNGKIVSFEKDVFMGFINSNTYKKIVLHPIDNPTKTTKIDLSEIDRRGEKIMDYEIINRDTIIILSWYTNKLFFINERGEIWKEKTIGPLKMNKMNCNIHFELTTLFNPILLNDSTLICGIEPYVDSDEFSNLPYAEFYEKLNKINAPRLVKVDNIFSDSLKFTFGMDDFYQRFMRDTEDRREMLGYNIINDKIICYSRYSDSIYIYDTDFDIENIICIESETAGNIGMTKVPLKAVEKNINIISETYLNQSIISGVHFLPDKECYLVNITHEKDDNNRSDWSSVVLDIDFNSIGEVFFSEADSLIEMTMRLHEESIYIYKRKKDDFINNGYNVYSLNFSHE